MKICEYCQQACPESANYCMECGNTLARETGSEQFGADNKSNNEGNWTLFWLTLGGSLFISWLLMAVFHLPVFILGAILPLLWYSRKK